MPNDKSWLLEPDAREWETKKEKRKETNTDNNNYYYNDDDNNENNENNVEYEDESEESEDDPTNLKGKELKRCFEGIFGKPVIRQEWLEDGRNSVDTEESERKATWTDLFLDLVFVAAISKLGLAFRISIEEEVSIATALGEFYAIFLPYFMHWFSMTGYSNRFDNGDGLHELFHILSVILFAWSAANLAVCNYLTFEHEKDFQSCSNISIFFGVLHVIALLMYLRVFIGLRKARSFVSNYIVYNFILASLWLSMGLVDLFVPHLSLASFTAFWWVTVILQVAGPFVLIPFFRFYLFPMLGLFLAHTRNIPLNIELYTERISCFFIIALGEAIVASTYIPPELLSGPGLEKWEYYLISLCIIATAFNLKLTYFDTGRTSVHDINLHALRWNWKLGLIWIVLHIPVVSSTLIVSSYFELALSTGHLDATSRWVFCLAMSFDLVSLTLLQICHKPAPNHCPVRTWIRLGCRCLISLVIALLPLIPEDSFKATYLILAFVILSSIGTLLDFSRWGELDSSHSHRTLDHVA